MSGCEACHGECSKLQKILTSKPTLIDQCCVHRTFRMHCEKIKKVRTHLLNTPFFTSLVLQLHTNSLLVATATRRASPCTYLYTRPTLAEAICIR